MYHAYQLFIIVVVVIVVVFRDVSNVGLSSMVTLPDSDKYDCVVCSCVADVDWDGTNEIVLGTYGQVSWLC